MRSLIQFHGWSSYFFVVSMGYTIGGHGKLQPLLNKNNLGTIEKILTEYSLVFPSLSMFKKCLDNVFNSML